MLECVACESTVLYPSFASSTTRILRTALYNTPIFRLKLLGKKDTRRIKISQDLPDSSKIKTKISYPNNLALLVGGSYCYCTDIFRAANAYERTCYVPSTCSLQGYKSLGPSKCDWKWSEGSVRR